MSNFSGKHIAVRPLPQGYALHVERAPMLLPGVAGHSDRAHTRRKADAFRSPAPLFVVSPPAPEAPEPDYAAQQRASARHWLLFTSGMLAAIVVACVLLATLTHH